jgi:hypothetical protein
MPAMPAGDIFRNRSPLKNLEEAQMLSFLSRFMKVNAETDNQMFACHFIMNIASCAQERICFDDLPRACPNWDSSFRISENNNRKGADKA